MFVFDNTYARDLPGFYEPCLPEPSSQPELLYFNHELAQSLGVVPEETSLTQCFSGNVLPDGAFPMAQVYAGHQFGHFNPRLGDGRALLLGEVLDPSGQRYDIALKGSGRTPFSRRGDGKATVGAMLREALISEAVHALGIPSTRTLAVVKTGDTVYRDSPQPGALLTRVAQSHIRIGTFEYFAARGEEQRLKQLADYTIARHNPELVVHEEPYLGLLASVCERQAALVAQWIGTGFIHGVMNTDNMSIIGETIDYGPCAFMEAFNPKAVFSSIDHQGRYAYQNQPSIAQWNLARFAEALLPLIDKDQKTAVAKVTPILDKFITYYQHHWLLTMLAKLGLQFDESGIDKDVDLIQQWLGLLEKQSVDYTLAWRHLADTLEPESKNAANFQTLFTEHEALNTWLQQWHRRGQTEGEPHVRAESMRQHNPWLIPRNHRVEEALATAANDGDMDPFTTLLQALQQPYHYNPVYAHLAEPASRGFTQAYQTFCGT